MKNKMKKIIATIMIGIILFGGTFTVQAATSGTTHVHQFYPVRIGTIQSVTSTHQYVTGVLHDLKGNVTGYTYGTCHITTYVDEYRETCSCGATDATFTSTRTEHSASHS